MELTLASRRGAALFVLFALTLWPLAHYGLHQVYGIDSWKLFGWSMYAQPPAKVRIDVAAVRGGRASPLSELAPRAQAALTQATQQRMVLGQLASTDALGRAVLAEHPDLDCVVIRAVRLGLDPTTGMYGERDSEIAGYERRAGSGACVTAAQAGSRPTGGVP